MRKTNSIFNYHLVNDCEKFGFGNSYDGLRSRAFIQAEVDGGWTSSESFSLYYVSE